MSTTGSPASILRRARFGLAPLALAALVLWTACEDSTGIDPLPRVETAVVLNSVERSVTVFPVDTPGNARTVGLGDAGSPVTLAARKNLVVVPMGTFPSAAVVDLTGPRLARSVALPAGSGATGVAFFDDSTAYVANSSLGTVSVLNVFRGLKTFQVEVGVWPQSVAARSDLVFVLNGELDASFSPAREGRVSVVEPLANAVVATIELSGFNPSAAVFGPDFRLYVVNSGAFGMANGSLSVIDPLTRAEIGHHSGFGEFPGDIAFGPDARVYVSAFAYGIAVWDPATETFVHPPSDPLVIDGHATSAGVGFDSEGRLYSIVPGDCIAPGSVLRVNADGSFDRAIPVGVCPIGIAFTGVGP